MKIVLSPLQKAAVLLSLSLGLAGCYKTTQTVQQTTAPAIVKDATVADLVKQLNGNFDAIKTLNASVTIAASTGGSRTRQSHGIHRVQRLHPDAQAPRTPRHPQGASLRIRGDGHGLRWA